MTFNRSAVRKTIAGVGLAGLLLVGVGTKPADARPPSHAPAHGYRGQSDRNHDRHCDCDRDRDGRRGRRGSSYNGAWHRDDCRHSLRSSNSRYGGYGYGNDRYGNDRYDNDRYDNGRYGSGRSSGDRYGNSGYNRGPKGDLDRDGRRNYWDQDKDGDGRRNERDRSPKNPSRR